MLTATANFAIRSSLSSRSVSERWPALLSRAAPQLTLRPSGSLPTGRPSTQPLNSKTDTPVASMVRHIVVTMNADFAGGVGHGEYSLESGWCGRIPSPSGAVCGVRLVRADRSGSIARPRSQAVLSDVPQQGMAGETRARPRARPCRPAARPVSCAEGRTAQRRTSGAKCSKSSARASPRAASTPVTFLSSCRPSPA